MELRESQLVALERLCEPGRNFGALWAEPRSGKTAVALRWLEHLQPPVAVVVGPKISEAVWRTEAAKWFRTDYRFYPLTAGNEYPDEIMFKGVTVLFVNYEQFGKMPFKRLKPYLARLAQYCDGKGAMILDEFCRRNNSRAVVFRGKNPEKSVPCERQKKAGHEARLKSNREVESDESFLKSSPSPTQICAVYERFKAELRIPGHGRYALCEYLWHNSRACALQGGISWIAAPARPRSGACGSTGFPQARSRGMR